MWSVALLLMLVAAGSSASPYGSFSHNVGVSSGVDTNGQEPVRDTPEVTLARQQHLEAVERQKALVGSAGAVPAVHAQHLAVVQDAHARAGVGSSVTPSWAVPFAVSSTPAYWGISSTPVPVQDTVEVAAAKAKHLAAVEEAKARLVAASSESAASSSYHQAYSSSSSSSAGHHQATYSVQSVTPPPVPHTVEVAAAREQQHLSSVAAARLSSAQSIAAQYSAQPRFHYPNVPVDFSPRLAAPLVAPAWPSAAVRFNTIASVEDASGRYVPDDEGQYDSRQDAEGQYDPRYDAEGQYDPRLNAEGHYVPSLNDEGQWIPSANEGQYVPGREDQAGEDNMPYSYSYSDGLSSKTEEKTADGITRGRFSYVDANGVLQAVDYQADNVLGFRASGTNLPQPPSAPGRGPSPIYSLPAPGPSFVATAFRAPVAAYGVPAPSGVAAAYAVPVPDLPADTPEVAAAKAAHFAAHREAGARLASAYSG